VSNNLPNMMPYVDGFDNAVPESVVANFGYSFRAPRVIDPITSGSPPATPANSNPSAIPMSPQGGYAMVHWDPAGGGNTAMWNSAAKADITFDCWVYIRNVALTGADTEQWSMGVRGTTESFNNYTMPGMTGLNNAAGMTGVNWTYYATATGATLSLLDEGNGGDMETVLVSIPIVPGVNDGWQRLRLQTSGNRIDAVFGGTVRFDPRRHALPVHVGDADDRHVLHGLPRVHRRERQLPSADDRRSAHLRVAAQHGWCRHDFRGDRREPEPQHGRRPDEHRRSRT
jgi:hypothetical protein